MRAGIAGFTQAHSTVVATGVVSTGLTVGKGKGKRDETDRMLVRHFHRTRDARFQEQLIRRHERLVWSIAWRYRESGEPVEDMAQEGFLGLLRAIDRFELSSPAKFSSYAALKIAGNIEHYLRDRSSTIRQPGWVQELFSQVRRAEQRLSQTLGRQPTPVEIAEELGESEERIAKVMETAGTRAVVSLDEPIGGRESEGLSLGELISDAMQGELTGTLDGIMDIERAMASLNEQQKRALHLCFYEDLTFEEAGGRMGMDRHRARRVVNRAVSILRERLQTAI